MLFSTLQPTSLSMVVHPYCILFWFEYFMRPSATLLGCLYISTIVVLVVDAHATTAPRWYGLIVLIICCWTTTFQRLDVTFYLSATWLKCISTLVLCLVINVVISLIWGAYVYTHTCGVRNRCEYSLSRPPSDMCLSAGLHKHTHVVMLLVSSGCPAFEHLFTFCFCFGSCYLGRAS